MLLSVTLGFMQSVIVGQSVIYIYYIYIYIYIYIVTH